MQIFIRNASGGAEAVAKSTVEGRTLIRLSHGQRLEIVDSRTGRVPVDLQARRGGPDGSDLILRSGSEIVEVEGFFAMNAEGDEAVAVSFPGGAVAEITPASAELASTEWANGSALMPDAEAAQSMAQPAFAASTAGASSAGAVAAGGTSAAAAGSIGWGWWAIGGLAAAGAGAAIANNSDDDNAPPPTPEPVPTFELTASVETVDEGENVVFTLATTNVAPGAQYEYEISGVSTADVAGGKLTGTVTIDANGHALIPVSLVEDLKTEGVETLTIAIAGQSYEVSVNDTSTAPEQTFSLSASTDVVDEGADVTFALSTTHVAPGTQYEYEISGVSAADVVGGKLTGTVTIDANGQALIPVSLVEDLKTEGVETLTIRIAGRSYAVSVEDTSTTPAFVLTPNLDDLTGTANDDVVYGNSTTYNAGDKIDGGEGSDSLSLSLASGVPAEGALVENIETVNVSTTTGHESVELRMTGYDDSVQQINVYTARADLAITDQQSLADISITDTAANVTLRYDSQLVLGESDLLNVAVNEFGGELEIDEGIESLNIAINDGPSENSGFALTAQGATAINLTGGRPGQGASVELEINNIGGDRAAGATLDGREFAGDLTLTQIQGGERTYSHSIEFTQGLPPGQFASIAVGELFQITVQGGEDGLSAQELADAFFAELSVALGSFATVHPPVEIDADRDVSAVVVSNLNAPMQDIHVEVAGTVIEVREVFDYMGGLSSSALNEARSGEVSTLLLGSGDDSVTVNSDDITYEDTYDLGNGENTLVVSDGSVYGTVKFGGSGSVLSVDGSIAGAAAVSFGVGQNRVDINESVTEQASVTFAGGESEMYVGGDIGGFAQIEFNGDGTNGLQVDGDIYGGVSVTFTGTGDNTLIADEIYGDADVSFGGGNNQLLAEEIALGATVSFGDGDNTLEVGEDIAYGAELSFGDGNNDVKVQGDIYTNRRIEFANGDNKVEVGGEIHRSTLEFGNGNNLLVVGDDVHATTIKFGDGANTVDVSGEVRRAELSFGDGDDNITVGREIHNSTMDLGAGDNVLSVGGAVKQGSQVRFGAGADIFNLGDGEISDVQMRGGGSMSSVDMDVGDDTVTIVRGNDGEDTKEAVVRSGAFLRGGEGQDSLTVRAVDDIDLVERTSKQKVTLTFDRDYTVGDVVSVTVGEDTFTYEVQAEDIVQGNEDNTHANVAQGLLAAINNGEDEIDPALSAHIPDDGDPDNNNIIVLSGVKGEADVEVHAEGATETVEQIADAGISGFEMLNLVAANPLTGEDGNDDEHCAANIGVDFDLVQDVEQINLRSEVDLRSEDIVRDGVTNGVYTKNDAGDVVEFGLENLPAGLGESIHVSAKEVTATGNRQVEGITIDCADGAHAIGDVITVRIDGIEYSIAVTAADLAGADAQEDASNIAARLADIIAAGEHGFTVALDQNQITLIGSADKNVETSLISDGEDDEMCRLQDATAKDDENADVIVNAHLSQGEDTDNDSLALVLDGTGDFDIAIDAEEPASEKTVRYEHLVLDVQDEYSHAIDTNADDVNEEFAGGKITLQGGVAGASIVISDVMASEVRSSSTADVTVRFNGEADAGEDPDYGFTVSTLSGNDTVDMSGVTLTRLSNIDLGEGVDRLVIGNSRQAADAAAGGSSELDLDRMFRQVSGVEELEVRIDGEQDGECIDLSLSEEVVLDDDAYEAGIERLYVAEDSTVAFQIGDSFDRALTGEMGDDVTTTFDIYNDYDVTLVADDELETRITLHADSTGDLTLTADEEAEVTVVSQGSGAIAIEVAEDSDVTVLGLGDDVGDVTVKAGEESDVVVLQLGTGAVDVTVEDESRVFIGGEGEYDVTVTQSDSDRNAIILEGVTEAQNVSLDVAVQGNGEDTIIKFFGEEDGWIGEDVWKWDFENGYGNTHLELHDGSGGIDTLTLRSQVDSEGEVNAGGVARVVVDDTWAVGGEGEGADFTIDASNVVGVAAGEGLGGGVFINATQENDANLKVIGSRTSTNILLGGQQADTLIGGEANDVLYGGAPAYELRAYVASELDVEQGISLIVDFDGNGPGDPISLTIQGEDAGEGDLDPDLFSSALYDFFYGDGESNLGGTFTGGEGGQYTYTAGEQSVSLQLNGATRASLPLAFEVAGVEVDFTEDEVGNYIRFSSADNNQFTVESNNANFDVERVQHGVADVLEGGAGDDIYVVSFSQLDTDSMTTIQGLDLGGKGEDEAGDRINLGSFFYVGDYDASDGEGMLSAWNAENQFLIGSGEGQGVINDGLVIDINGTGATLQAAVDELFGVNGVFQASSDAATNSAGLFTYGEDTYLIAVGNDIEGGFGADDFIVKVTGYTGTLDESDFYVHPIL